MEKSDKKSFKEIWEISIPWTELKIEKEILKRNGFDGAPESRQRALEQLAILPSHQCYWNDRFAIAVMFNLDWDIQKKTAWCAINNGLSGYWEWITHGGYNLQSVLQKIGVNFELEQPNLMPRFCNNGYCLLHISYAKQLAEYFELPSQYLRPNAEIDDDAKIIRRELWSGYSHSQGNYLLERD